MAPKVAPSHPPYVDIIKEAITSLKERNGSSNQAIRKFVASKHPNLPANWEKVLGLQLRRLTESGKLTKVTPVPALTTSAGQMSRDVDIADQLQVLDPAPRTKCSKA